MRPRLANAIGRTTGLLALGLLAACADAQRPRPETPRDRVLAAWSRFVDAALSEDFARVWDLSAELPRRLYVRLLERLKGQGGDPGPSDVPFTDPGETLARLARSTGMSPEDLLSLEPREFFAAIFEAEVDRRRDEWDRQVEAVGRLEVREVELEGDRSSIDFVLDDEWALTVRFRREKGEWRFESGVDRAFLASSVSGRPAFRRLERKVPAYLPRRARLEDVVAVVEGGPEEPDDDDLSRVRALLRSVDRRGRESPSVVLDVAGDVSFAGFLQYYDAVRAEGFDDVYFAMSVRPDHWGARESNPFFEEAGDREVRWPENVIAHPALARVLGADPWDRWRLEFLLERER